MVADTNLDLRRAQETGLLPTISMQDYSPSQAVIDAALQGSEEIQQSQPPQKQGGFSVTQPEHKMPFGGTPVRIGGSPLS